MSVFEILSTKLVSDSCLASCVILIIAIFLFSIENLLSVKKSINRRISVKYNSDNNKNNDKKRLDENNNEMMVQSLDDVPKWKGWPFFGCSLSLGALPHVTLAKIAKSYFNDKIFRLQAGEREFVVFTKYDDIIHLARKYPEELFGKPKSFTTTKVTIGAHNDLVERWKKRRAYTNAGLKHLERYNINDIISDEIDELLSELNSVADIPDTNPVDIRHDITYHVSKVMHRMSYGNNLDGKSENSLKDIVDRLYDYTTTMGSLSIFDMLPFVRKFFKKRFSKFIEFNQILKIFCEHEKNKCLAKEKEVAPSDNLFMFFREKLEKLKKFDENKYTEFNSVIYDGLEDIIRAGTESTSLTLQWFLLYAAKFQHVQKKMQSEIDQVLNKKHTAKLDLEHYKDLPYCQAVLAETLRYCSLNPFLKRELTGDVITKDGTLLPAGTALLFNNWALNFDEKFWDEPAEFRPERFLDPNGQMDSNIFEHLLSFGFGKRRCIGVYTGKAICHFAAVNIMYNFNVKPATCDLDLEPINGIGLSPKPFKVLLKKRSTIIHNETNDHVD